MCQVLGQSSPLVAILSTMREESQETPRALRYGYTTGACATAASLAAARRLLTGVVADTVTITLPRGQIVTLPLAYCREGDQGAEAAVCKDAGDDPDVTHGALIFARVTRASQPGVSFHAAEGVGTVTRPGLPLAVGEPAINPVPRRMMREHLQVLAATAGYPGGFAVAIGVVSGEALAERTLNGRLGIVGGLSILGTTGIVRPFSCSAYIATIHRAIDVARANGLVHLAACTGASSEQAMRRRYQLPEMALIEMGDFAGAVLKYLRRQPVPRLSLAGGFGKFCKLAAGHLDLHSRASQVDFDWLAAQAAAVGADPALQAVIRTANTSQAVLAVTQAAGLPLGDWICRLAQDRAAAVVGERVQVEVWALDRQGELVGFAGSG